MVSYLWVKTDNDMWICLRKTLSLSTYLQNMNVIIVCSSSETDTRKETQKRETY